MIIKINFNILVLLIINFFNTNLYGQCHENINTISTDWRNYPISSNNNWNWTLPGAIHPVYLDNNQSIPSLYIELPYFCTKPLGSASCDGFHNVEEYQIKGNSKDFQDINPEDGWELLFKDFGSPNPQGQNTGGTGRNNPFFILYNKYNGKMKIFVAMMGIHSKQSSFVRIGFDNMDPGTVKTSTNQANRTLFSAAEPIQKTLLEFKPVLEFKQMNQVLAFQSQNDYQWMVCELTTTYDPCTCQNTIDNLGKVSTLTMQLINVGTVNIEAIIDGKATTEVLASGTTASSTADGSLASFFDVVTDGGNAAQKGKTQWSSTQKTMLDIIDFGNKVLVKELAKEWLKKDNPNFDNDELKNLNNAALKQLLAAPDSIKKMFGVRQANDTKLGVILEASKGIASNLPYVGMAIGIIDYLVDGGEENKISEKSGPVTYDINLSLKGTLTEDQSTFSTTFFNPGSPIPANVGNHLTPFYNNVLGVFNVLELPDLEYAEILPTITLWNRIDHGNECMNSWDEFNNFEGAGQVNLRQYRPKSNIKYVVNPASNMEVISIDAAIVFEYNENQPLFITRPDQISSATAIPFHNYMVISNNQLDDFCNIFSNIPNCDPDLTGLERRVDDITNSTNLKLDYASSGYPNESNSFIRFRTNYVPITCFTSSNFLLLGTNNFGKVFVKLYVKLKNKNLPNAEPVTTILTYDWTEKVINSTNLQTITGSYSASIFANNWTLKERFRCYTSFSSFNYFDYSYHTFWSLNTIPFGNKGMYLGDNYYYSNEQNLIIEDRLIIPTGSNIPNNSIIKAGGKITIEPGVTFGNNIIIQSGIKIDIGSPNNINPSVQFEILDLNQIVYSCNDYNYLPLHNTNNEIEQYCNNQLYKNLVYNKNLNDSIIFDQNPINKGLKKIFFKIAPNPSSSDVEIIFYENHNNLNISLLDLNGKILINEFFINTNQSIKLRTSNLSSGIYFIKIENKEGLNGTEKFIKL